MLPKPKKLLRCGHCGNRTTFQVKGSCEKKGDFRYGYDTDGESVPEYFSKTTWYLLSCETCSAAILECVLEYCVAPIETGAQGEDCDELERWILYPSPRFAPDPIAGMPEDVKKDYEEACAVLPASPRACAALLRLALQRLCVHLGQPGENLSKEIKVLIQQKELKPHVQQALHIVRVIGNNAVHPGEMDLDDNQEIALSLFTVINLIVEEMIVIPNQMKALYSALPENERKKIEGRGHPRS